MFLNHECSVENDIHGNDHFPVILNTHHNGRPYLNFMLGEPMSSEAMDSFTSNLSTIAGNCIPETSGISITRRNPRFNDDCMEDLVKRDLRHFKHEPTYFNLDAL